jgi:uncharacterized membrane protein
MSAPTQVKEQAGLPALEARLAWLLSRGAMLAVGLLVVGIVLMLARGLTPLDLPPRLGPGQLIDDLKTLHPAGFLWLGTIVLLATPVARLVVAVAGLAGLGDRSRIAVGLATLGLIALGVVVGLASGG